MVQASACQAARWGQERTHLEVVTEHPCPEELSLGWQHPHADILRQLCVVVRGLGSGAAALVFEPR